MVSLSKIEFFNSYFELLCKRGIQSVVLHTYDEYPENIHSDVDYCVSDSNLSKIIPLVCEHCKASGWRLIQIMQHEAKAYFCVCVSKDSPEMCVELDVCSDYMREGKTLLSADSLLSNARKMKGKSFYIPSIANEFAYSLFKSVAKGKPKSEMLMKLNELYLKDAVTCESLLQNMGVVDGGNLVWSEDAPRIYDQYVSYYQKMSVDSRFGEFKRRLHRVIRPSGLLLLISSRREVEVQAVSCGGNAKFAHSFRKVRIPDDGRGRLKDFLVMLRSTLFVYQKSTVRVRCLLWLGRVFGASLVIQENGENIEDDVLTYLENRVSKRWKC